MSTTEPVILDVETNGDGELPPQRLTLLDRLDPAIGDASAGIGALLTELVRRSLRGGVSNIDHHLLDFAHEQVHAAVENQLPKLQEFTSEIAETCARQISKSTAVELTEITEAKTRQVASVLKETDERLTRALSDTHQDLTVSLTQTRQSAADLEGRIVAVRDETAETMRTFEADLRESSKRSWEKVKVQLEELRGQTAAIPDVAGRVSRAEAGQQEFHQRLERMRAEYEQQRQGLATQLQAALEQCAVLSTRLEALERPRGFRAWIQKLRGGNSKPAELRAPEEPDED